MKKKLVARIWMSYMDLFDHIQQTPTNIHFELDAEAEKCVKYMNSKIKETGKKSYFYKKEYIVEYKTAKEYIAEKEAKNELNK